MRRISKLSQEFDTLSCNFLHVRHRLLDKASVKVRGDGNRRPTSTAKVGPNHRLKVDRILRNIKARGG